MLLKSEGITIIRRVIFILIIAVCVYKFEINHAFFGFWIALFLLLLILSGSTILKIEEDEVVIHFKRFLPFISQKSRIKYDKIIDVHYSERKLEPVGLALNIIVEYVPGTSRSGGILTIIEKGGKKYQIDRVGSKENFQKAVDLIKSRTNYRE